MRGKAVTRMLTPKQRAFVTEYVLDKNAIRAGYSPATAGAQGSELLKKPEIQAGIEAKLADTAARNESTFNRWIRRLWEEADDFSEMSSHSARVGALKEIGKALGYYEAHNAQKAPVVHTIRLVPLKPRGVIDRPSTEAGGGHLRAG